MDAIVVGGGPAGLSAATWLARYRHSVLVVDDGRPRNRWTDEGHGYFGVDPFRPSELTARARERLEKYPTATVLTGAVEEVRGEIDAFVVRADTEHEARRIVLASGVEDVFPAIPGFEEHFGANVFHCPGCDGYEVRGRNVVVVGWDPTVIGLARALVEWAATVTVVTPPAVLREESTEAAELRAAGVQLVADDVAEICGPRSALECVRLTNGRRVSCDAAFFAIDCRPRAPLAAELGCEFDEDGFVRVDEHGRTSVAGVYAAGDMTPGLQLVQVAAAGGAIAGVHCAHSLA